MRFQVLLPTVFGIAALLLLRIVFPDSAEAALHKNVLHVFENKPAANPYSDLIFDASGSIYGATQRGGSKECNCGTVFQLSPKAGGGWRYRVIYEFQGKNDGGYPIGNIVFDDNGNLYGVGANGNGNVFKLTPQSDNTWTETTIHAFGGGADGSEPQAGLTIDREGNIYGTTRYGGSNGMGTVYELTPESGGGWSETVLHSFSGTDGEQPLAGVFIDQVGNLYGTTMTGGDRCACGVVFELRPDGKGGWAETVLYAFLGGGDHEHPEGGVVLDSSGNIYGTNSDDGTGSAGSVFELTKNPDGTWSEITLHAFGSGHDGEDPRSDLVSDAAGNLYGTTYVGGEYGPGIIFKLSKEAGGKWVESTYLSFDSWDGSSPTSRVTFDAAGNLFVPTYYGGRFNGKNGYGVVLEIIH